MTSDTSEKGFQQDFIDYLTGTGYVKRTTNDYDTVTSLGIALQCKEDFKYAGQPNLNFVNNNLRFVR